jgi:hypothetical protein
MVDDEQLDKIVRHLCEQLPGMVKLASVDGSLTPPLGNRNCKLEPEDVRPVVFLALQMAGLVSPSGAPPLP